MNNNVLMFSTLTNFKDNKLMNKTINSFGTFKKLKNIPVLTSYQCQSSDYEFKFNKNFYKNKIESISNKSSKKIKLKTDINQNKMLNKQIIYSLKHYNLDNKNNINILKFNNSISNTPNNNFHGKKILLSKHPLLCRNKFISNNKKNLEINSSFFNNKNENEKNIYSFDGTFNNKIIYKSGDYFSNRIENELKNIWNKSKNNNISNNFESYRQIYFNQNNNKYLNTITNFNIKNNFNYLQTEGDIFPKRNKIKLIKNINNRIPNSNYNNKYLTPDNMFRKVVYVDHNNQTISLDKTVNLLKNEKDYFYDNLPNILLSYYFDEKGNLVSIPFGDKKWKFYNGKFLTEFGNKKFELEASFDPHRKGKLGKLIEERFTKTNYRNITPSRKKSIIEFNYNSSKYDDVTSNYKYNHNINNIGDNTNSNNIFKKIITNSNNSPISRRKRKEKNKDNVLNDILGVIKSKVIGSPNKKEKQNDIKKEERRKSKNFIRSSMRTMSRLENVMTDFNYTNKYFEDENKLNSTFLVKDSKGNSIKVNFIKKDNNVLAPINEEGEVIKDMRILNDIYELTKNLNLENKKKMFRKRFSVDINANFKNPLLLSKDKENSEDIPKKLKEENNNNNNNLDNNNNINNNILVNKINEEKEKEKLSKKERDQKFNKLLNNIPKLDKKQAKTSSKYIKIKKNNVKKNISSKSPKKINNLSGIKNEPVKKEEPEITDPIVKELLNNMKNNTKNESRFYNEEDDFIKDFNIDFYSSSEESETVSLQKKMRHIRKKKNKYLFSIFNFIAKNTNFSKDFTKQDLIKYLMNQEFKFNFEQLREQIAKGRILSYNSLYNNGMDINIRKSVQIKDLEIINYLFRYIEDKDSIFYRAIYRPKNRKNKKEKNTNSNNETLNFMLDQKKLEELKKKKRFSVFYRKQTKEYLEDKYKPHKKKFEKKKKPQNNADNEIITNSEKKLLMLNEINLTNELKYQISVSNDKESREKFKNLLNKIEGLRSLDSNEYIKSLKRNYEMYKEEVKEIIRAKEIEERLNGFIDSLNYQRSNLKDKHKYIMSLLYIKDNRFESTFENNAND